MTCSKKTWLWDLDANKGSDVMKTTTQIMLEEGAKAQRKVCVLERKLVNFSSFNMDDPRYGAGQFEDELAPPLLTTYMRQYKPPYPSTCKPIKPKADTPDFLFNRFPQNAFDPQTGIAFKFLDDHMHVDKLSEARKKIDFFRQLRNQSFFIL